MLLLRAWVGFFDFGLSSIMTACLTLQRTTYAELKYPINKTEHSRFAYFVQLIMKWCRSSERRLTNAFSHRYSNCWMQKGDFWKRCRSLSLGVWMYCWRTVINRIQMFPEFSVFTMLILHSDNFVMNLCNSFPFSLTRLICCENIHREKAKYQV